MPIDGPAAVRLAALAAGGVVALLGDQAPTGLAQWDAFLRIVSGAFIVHLCLMTATRSWLVILPPLVVYVGLDRLLFGIGLIALVVVAATKVEHRTRRRFANGLAACVLVDLMGHLPDRGFFGSSTIAVAAVVIVLVAVRDRWPLTRGILASAAGAVVLVGIVGAFPLIVARGPLESGAQAAERAGRLTQAGDFEAASVDWQTARREFSSAENRLGAWWAKPARLVPVVAQNVALAHVSAEVGSTMAAAGSTVGEQLQPAQWRLASGELDFAAIEGAHEAVRDANAAAFVAEGQLQIARNPWTARRFDTEVARAVEQLRESRLDGEILAEGLRLAPDLFGRTERRAYLAVFANPAEAREMGGLLSAYAVVSIEHGVVSLDEVGVNDDLVRSSVRGDLDLAALPPSYANYRLNRFPINLTGTPDIHQLFDGVRDVLPTLGDGRLDGLLYLDPVGVEAVVALAGGVRIPSADLQLNANNTSAFLLRDQYFVFEDARARDAALVRVVEQSMGSFAERLLADPSRAARLLGPSIAGNRLQMITTDPATNNLLGHVGMLREFAVSDGHDFLAVLHVNRGENKLDPYVSRRVSYDVQLEPETATLSATVTVTIDSSIPSEIDANLVSGSEFNEQTPERHRITVVVYSPHEILEAMVDGVATDHERIAEYGLMRYAVPLEVGPDQTRQVVFSLQGSLAVDLFEQRSYALDIWQQPLASDDLMRVSVSALPPWVLEADSDNGLSEVGHSPSRSVTTEWPLDRDRTFAWQLQRPG